MLATYLGFVFVNVMLNCSLDIVGIGVGPSGKKIAATVATDALVAMQLGKDWAQLWQIKMSNRLP